ncbi:MAG: winged helix-turn-helix transcriptional regulator [Ignavibacteria bacterium]|nr:winged helix-turn-helix transcriptional regulator [Ignavibacteria bacterium]MBL7991689.1 winged helix-turn-helix transcriptional regulator [Candidatus Kapabacteria bacterium]
MTRTKTELFTPDETRLAELAKALAHPARIAILKMLATKNSCICGEIVDELPLAQATVSQHLKELKNVGLIKGEIDGPKVCYCLNEDGIKELRLLWTALEATVMAKCC